MSAETASNTPANKKLVVVLAGPTAVGKSDVAAQLCASLGGMIVSADSVQAYRGVQIGANKPTPEELVETPHLLVDIVDSEMNYNAAEWQRDALHVVSSLLQQEQQQQSPEGRMDLDPLSKLDQERRADIDQTLTNARKLERYSNDDNNDNKPILPVVVGGTMMYLQWLVHGRPDAAKPNKETVEQAHKEIGAFQEADDFQGAMDHVAAKGPIFAQRLTKLCGKDWYRLRRTLEIALTAQTQAQQNDNALIEKLFTGEREGSLESYGYDVRCFFLCPDLRMAHTKLVDERCEVMISRGLLRETTDLKLAGQLPDMAARAIGYRQTLQYLEREGAKDQDEDAFQEFLNQFTTATRQYSKKQMQWFRKDKSFVFVPVAIEETKAARVKESAKAIEEMIRLPREEYDRQCFSEDSVSAKTKKENEAQGKGMKFYQMKRYRLLPGTPELEKALAEADQCTNQLQAKKQKATVQGEELSA